MAAVFTRSPAQAAAGSSDSSSSSGGEVTMQFVLEKKFAGALVTMCSTVWGTGCCSMHLRE
jgi:hypothetical protein